MREYKKKGINLLPYVKPKKSIFLLIFRALGLIFEPLNWLMSYLSKWKLPKLELRPGFSPTDGGINLLPHRYHVAPKKKETKTKVVKGKYQIKEEELVWFAEQFGLMLDAGIPIVQILDLLGGQAKERFRGTIYDVKRKVEDGACLHEAMGNGAGFPSFFVSVVGAGELGGILDTVMHHLVELMDQKRKYDVSFPWFLPTPGRVIRWRAIQKKAQLAYFCRMFFILISSGVQVLEVLEVLAKEMPNKKMRDACTAVRIRVLEGKNIADPMSEFKCFQEIVELIAVGECTGRLDAILQKIAEMKEKEIERIAGRRITLTL